MKLILVVDDEDLYRQAVSGILKQAGYSVLEAENGEKALELLQHHVPDLIVSDVAMGELDGFAFIDRLRMDPATSRIPFVFVSGLADKDSMRRGMTLGADDFLTKPFTGPELLSAVEARLTKHQERAEEAERRLSQLRSSISMALPHEIRTPLAGILGFAEVLGDEASNLESAEITQYGRLIHKAGQRLQRLLENFTIYAQIEVLASDPKRLASERNSRFLASAEKIGFLCQKKAEASGRTDDLRLNLIESAVEISESHLTKICEELLDNAFKFSRPGTPVIVSTRNIEREFVLSVADGGRGMTRDQIANLGGYVQFERKFYEQQGAGLGLIIAKRLTEIHGGRVEFEPGKEGGLTVRVFLPRTSVGSSANAA
jgi:signal transduction histidine kinase